MSTFLDLLFGCWHRNYSFPLKPARVAGKPFPIAAAITGHYVVCLDCGREFPYDWVGMKVISEADVEVSTEGAIA